jgi:hypothetical protein
MQPAIVISSDNYKIIQIKKNLNDYVSLKKRSRCLTNRKTYTDLL